MPPRDWLMHALGRAALALRDPDCAPLLGPPVPGATLPLGARVPGTSLELDPASAAFNLGAMICGERPGPADHVAAALAAADYAARQAHYVGRVPPSVADLLDALRRADGFGRALARDDLRRADPNRADPNRADPGRRQRAADAWVAASLLGCDAAQQHEAARRAGLDGSPVTDGLAAHASRREQRRAAGENAARALRHALAVMRETSPSPSPSPSTSTALSPAGAAALTGATPERGDARGADAPGASSPCDSLALEPDCLGDVFAAAVAAVYPPAQAAAIVDLFGPGPGLEALAVDAFVARLVRN